MSDTSIGTKFTPHSCFDDAWLGLGDTSKLVVNNPLLGRTVNDLDNPGLHELRVMRNPNYLAFAAKYLLGVELLPIQALILKELWIRPFPMLIGSRGFSKCVDKNTWIHTNNGFCKIGSLLHNIPEEKPYLYTNLQLYGDVGFQDVAYGWKNKKQSCIKIKTSQGFILSGTLDHPIRVVDNGKIVWKQLQNIQINDYIPIDRSDLWFDNTNNISEDVAYLFGCLVGDGEYTQRGHISFTTKDREIVDKLNITTQQLWGKSFRKQKEKYGYLLCGVNIWDELFQKYGFNSPVCAEKDFPQCILSSSKSVMASFLRGLWDTNGHCRKQSAALYYSAKSANIIDTMQFVLTRFGIISRRYKYFNKKYNRYYYHLTICGEHVKIFHREIGFNLQYKQQQLEQYLDVHNNTNLDILPHDLVLVDLLNLRQKCFDDNFVNRNEIKWHQYYLKHYQLSYKKLHDILNLTQCYNQEESWQNLQNIAQSNYFYDKVVAISTIEQETYDFHIPEGHSFITNGFISHNTFLTAVLSLLKCILIPNTKIVIAGAAFRQSKFVFEYMEAIWRNASVLRSVCTNSSGPRRGTDQWIMYINDSTATAIPIGCLTGNTLLTTQKGILYLQDLQTLNSHDEQIWSQNQFRNIGQFFNNGLTNVYNIITKTGLEFAGTNNHKMQVVRNNRIQWVRTDQMKIGDRILVDRTNRWFDCPTFACSDNEAYCLGLMIGDGNYTNKYYLRFTTKDKEFLPILNQVIGPFRPQNDKLHYQFSSKKGVENWLNFWQMSLTHTKDKKLPKTILSAGKSQVAACLRGLFDTDGHVYGIQNKGGLQCRIGFTNTSKELVRQIQFLLLHFGIISYIKYDDRVNFRTGNHYSRIYDLYINGPNVKKFYEQIGFGLNRKQEYLQNIINKKKRWFHIDDNIPIDKDILLNLVQQYNFGSRYGLKDIQARNTFTHDYLQKLLTRAKEKNIHDINLVLIQTLCNPNIYYDIITDISNNEYRFTYDINVPDTNIYCANGFISHNSGEKIRGLRANTLIMDEFASIDPEIYETVLAGFTVVSADPVSNVKEAASRDAMLEANVWSREHEERYSQKTGNQIVLSGTASYDFEHFAEYWRRYRSIITSKGDESKLREVLSGDTTEFFNWKDFSIIRIPYELVPEGFMDDKQIIRAKATMHSGTYGREYGAVFVKDSNGFFKRTLIESCIANDKNIKKPGWPKWCQSKFEAVLHGRPDKQYVFGIDPASEQDNFSIVVLELWAEHTRIVYGWSTNRQDFRNKINAGLTEERDFYGYCARKIRNLMKVFPCIKIGMDGQGGGIAVEEALHDPDKIDEGEVPIWPIIEDKEKSTDHHAGLHILEMCQFVRADWTADANHGLRKDLEDKVLLFPFFDMISLGLAAENDKRNKEIFEHAHPDKVWHAYDSLEDCVMEIEDLKDELSTIVQTRVGTGMGGRDRWSTPEVKLNSGKKGRLRKDRYSALVIANMIARQINRTPPVIEYETIGGMSHKIEKADGIMYHGPEWFTSTMGTDCVFGISH